MKTNSAGKIPTWLNTLLSIIIGFFTVFAGAWGGLRAFEKSMVKTDTELATRLDEIELEYAKILTELKMADQHALDVIEMNRQVRMEQLKSINEKCDELKSLVQRLIDDVNGNGAKRSYHGN